MHTGMAQDLTYASIGVQFVDIGSMLLCMNIEYLYEYDVIHVFVNEAGDLNKN